MKKYMSEFVGTAVLVIFGCGSAVSANMLVSNIQLVPPIGSTLALTTLLIAFAFGLVIVAMAYSIGNVSGCHINPAVSTAMLVSGKMTTKDYVGYIIAQFLGAIIGALVLFILVGAENGLGQNGFAQQSALGTNLWQAFLVEVILTFVFVIAIIGVTSKTENGAVVGIVIGLTLVLVHIFGIPFTGTSVNPARSFGPVLILLFAGNSIPMSQVWVFILAPIVGSILAALTYKGITAKD